MDRFIRAGIIAAIAGGLLLAVGAFLPLLPPDYEHFSAEVVTARFAVSSALRLAGAILMIWGLSASTSGKLTVPAGSASSPSSPAWPTWCSSADGCSPTCSSHRPSPARRRRFSTATHPHAWQRHS